MELATILEQYHERFIARYAQRISPAQQQAIGALRRCRTAAAGEQQVRCTGCDRQQRHPLSCGHRSCPQCQNHEATHWLERQRAKLLPVEYFMVTFTLPAELRALAFRRQSDIYALLFACAVSTLKDFGLNPKKLGADIGMTAILHTHTRRLDYHPHVHIVVPGGGIDARRRQWKKTKGKYLFNAFALARVFRARFLAALHAANLSIPANLPNQWVVDCAHVGQGQPALEYLSRYLYRGVISEKNIVANQNGNVTFRYTQGRTGQTHTRTLKGEDFLWLVLQHVLPKGFRRARDYGFLHGNAKRDCAAVLGIHFGTSKSPKRLRSAASMPAAARAVLRPSRHATLRRVMTSTMTLRRVGCLVFCLRQNPRLLRLLGGRRTRFAPCAPSMLLLVQLVLQVVIAIRAPRPRPVFKCRMCQAPMCVVAVLRPAWRSG